MKNTLSRFLWRGLSLQYQVRCSQYGICVNFGLGGAVLRVTSNDFTITGCRNDKATLVNMLILLGLDVIVVFSGSFESFSREIVFFQKNLEMSRFYIQYDRV